jgi:hypothetical protein
VQREAGERSRAGMWRWGLDMLLMARQMVLRLELAKRLLEEGSSLTL